MTQVHDNTRFRDTDRITPDHDFYMREALAQARLALGRTAPNPAVGAVVVKDGQILGRGFTRPPGGPHAEVTALNSAGDQAQGATLYVTLEPCSHHGRTPPCTDAVLRSGVHTVYIATQDPFPEVNGNGIHRLRSAGINVHVGLYEQEARRLNEGFFKRVLTGLPFTLAKYAMTLDGRIATRTGNSRWITGEEARLNVHRTRDQVDGILVGSGTVIADDPELTTRLPQKEAGAGGSHHPLRIVIDSKGRIPLTAKILTSDLPGKTLMVCTTSTSQQRINQLEQQGIENLVMSSEDHSISPRKLLTVLGERGLNTILIEGGGETLYQFFSSGLVDRVNAYIAPKLVGGQTAPGPLGGLGVATMQDAWHLRDIQVHRFGEDTLIDGYVAYDKHKQEETCSAE